MDDEAKSREELLLEIQELKRQLSEKKSCQTCEKALRALMEASTETIFLMEPSGQVLIANQTAAQRLHTTLDQLLQSNMFDLLPSETAERRRLIVQEVLHSRQPALFEDERLDRIIQSSIFPVLAEDGQVVSLAIFGRDVTEERRSQIMLSDSEERYRSLFQNNHAVLLIIDPENGQIIDANPAACKYYGYTQEHLRSMQISDINILTPEEIHQEMTRAREEERNHFYFSHRLSNEEIRAVEVYSGPVTMHGKQLLYSIVHDISARKKAEEDRERLIAELQVALSKVQTLKGMLPICASCKKIRNDHGYWQQIESYIHEHSQAEFTHGLCPDCVQKLYPELEGHLKSNSINSKK